MLREQIRASRPAIGEPTITTYLSYLRSLQAAVTDSPRPTEINLDITFLHKFAATQRALAALPETTRKSVLASICTTLSSLPQPPTTLLVKYRRALGRFRTKPQ